MLQLSKVILSFLVLSFPLITSAKDLQNNVPAKCPNVAVVQAEGLDVVYDEFFDRYYGKKVSKYDTNDDWGFGIGYFQASSLDEAKQKVQDGLMMISGNPEPANYRGNGWFCVYETGTDRIAVAGFVDKNSNQPSILQLLK